MFKKILVLLKKGLKAESKIVEYIKNNSNSEVIVVLFDNLNKNSLKNIDLIITIGGDGTFVKAGNLVEDSAILGINSEPDRSEGALTSIDVEDYKKLKDVLSGKFDINYRHRAKIKLNGKILDEHALNEVYIGSNSQFHTSRYKIRFNGSEEEHRSSGLIISTGTGSPAWFYSAGGKIFNHDEEKLGFIVREPYFGKRVFKPKIINGDIVKGEKITIESTRQFGGIIAINDATYHFNEGDVVEVELSDKPLKVIIPK